jgi:hypothetical protein
MKASDDSNNEKEDHLHDAQQSSIVKTVKNIKFTWKNKFDRYFRLVANAFKKCGCRFKDTKEDKLFRKGREKIMSDLNVFQMV